MPKITKAYSLSSDFIAEVHEFADKKGISDSAALEIIIFTFFDRKPDYNKIKEIVKKVLKEEHFHPESKESDENTEKADTESDIEKSLKDSMNDIYKNMK